MNRQDIFIMAYYCLDAYCDDFQTEELGNLCSLLNPFLFTDRESADPAYWAEFCELYEDKNYSIEEGYKIAKKYNHNINSFLDPSLILL